MARFTLARAVPKIVRRGALLVFPMNNAPEPRSLWQEFFPRKKMLWEWDDDGDHDVADLWHLRGRLSDSGRIVYSKWYRGRATMFSPDVFAAMVHLVHFGPKRAPTLSLTARRLLDALDDNSPQSPRQLKALLDLKGRDFERDYTRALKELWEALLIVGYGEIDDGAFPSLALGSSRSLFEKLWERARRLSDAEAQSILDGAMPLGSAFRKFWDRLRS